MTGTAARSCRSTKTSRTSPRRVPAPRPPWSGRAKASRSTTTAAPTAPPATSAPPRLPTAPCFRVVSFGPGVSPRNHRTDSIDYATVISGEIDMELDGPSVHLKAGDLLVQRGTIHNWVNKGTAPCVIAFVLVGAKPVTAGGKVLKAVEQTGH